MRNEKTSKTAHCMAARTFHVPLWLRWLLLFLRGYKVAELALLHMLRCHKVAVRRLAIAVTQWWLPCRPFVSVFMADRQEFARASFTGNMPDMLKWKYRSLGGTLYSVDAGLRLSVSAAVAGTLCSIICGKILLVQKQISKKCCKRVFQNGKCISTFSLLLGGSFVIFLKYSCSSFVKTIGDVYSQVFLLDKFMGGIIHPRTVFSPATSSHHQPYKHQFWHRSQSLC